MARVQHVQQVKSLYFIVNILAMCLGVNSRSRRRSINRFSRERESETVPDVWMFRLPQGLGKIDISVSIADSWILVRSQGIIITWSINNSAIKGKIVSNSTLIGYEWVKWIVNEKLAAAVTASAVSGSVAGTVCTENRLRERDLPQ